MRMPFSGNAAGHGGRIQADELRIGEQVAVAVVLRGLEHDVGLRHIDQVRDAEQQEELLADAGFEILLDLLQVQRAVVDRRPGARTPCH